MQENDSDDGPTHENSYRLSSQDKEHIFRQIKHELDAQDVNIKPIESNYWQVLRKKEFYDGYKDYLDLADAQGSPRQNQTEGLIIDPSPDGANSSRSPGRRSRSDRLTNSNQSPFADNLMRETPVGFKIINEESKADYYDNQNDLQYSSPELKSFEQTPDEIKGKATIAKTFNLNKRQQMIGDNVFSGKNKLEDHQTSISFANKNSQQTSPENILNSSGGQYIGMRNPMFMKSEEEKKEVHYYNASPSIDAKKNKQVSIDYPSFGNKTHESRDTQNNSRTSHKSNDIQDEVQKYLQYLVSKYEQLDDKTEAEALILELNRISNNDLTIPINFIEKFNKFKDNEENPPQKMIKSVTSTTKKRRPQTSRIEETQNKGLGDSKIQSSKKISDFMNTIQNSPELVNEYEELVSEYEE